MPTFDLSPYRPVALDDLVRVGRDSDGGYVVSRRSVDAARALVGLGINNDWSFEADFVRRNPTVRVVGVDGSVSPGEFRRRARPHVPRALGGLVRAQRSVVLGELGAARSELRMARDMARFFDGGRRHFVPHYFEPDDTPSAVSWATLGHRFDLFAGGDARSGPCDVFLKMDIEGAEYRTLGGVVGSAERLAGVVIEFHDLDRQWYAFTALMDALAPSLAIAHLHGNNNEPLVLDSRTPRVLEVSLVNRRLLDGPAVPSTATLPLPGLDRACHSGRPDYALHV